MKYKLLASAASLENIKKVVCKYFYNNNLKFIENGDVINIENSKGLLKYHRIVKKKNRYRFEVTE